MLDSKFNIGELKSSQYYFHNNLTFLSDSTKHSE